MAASSIPCVQTFLRLMTQYAVPRNDTITIGHTDYLDKPVRGKFFWGHDERSRVFINIPVAFHHNDADFDPGTKLPSTGTFIVFQRYINNDNIFTTGGDAADIFDMYEFLDEDLDNLTHLENLLGGQTIEIRGTYATGHRVKITLKK